MATVRTFPQAGRWIALGAAPAGAVGAIVGLIVGFFVYPPTALFAMIELGFPAAIVGGVLGLLIGSISATARRISRNRLAVTKACPSDRSPT
jgi:hypothetical protein